MGTDVLPALQCTSCIGFDCGSAVFVCSHTLQLHSCRFVYICTKLNTWVSACKCSRVCVSREEKRPRRRESVATSRGLCMYRFHPAQFPQLVFVLPATTSCGFTVAASFLACNVVRGEENKPVTKRMRQFLLLFCC